MLFTEADRALTQRIGIINAHDDFPLGILKQRFNGTYQSLRDDWLPRFRAGGVQMVVAAVFTPSVYLPEGALRHALQVIDALCTEVEENPGDIELVRSAADARRIMGAGKIGVLLAMEGAEPLGDDLSALRLLYKLGLRMLSFTWHRRTAFGDGAWENESGGGLSRLGRQAVGEMNRLGIIVDVSHASDRTTSDILKISTKPVIASHSNARAVLDHPRNVTDDMIRAIAASGGVVGGVAVSRFTAEGVPTIAQWANHFEHIIRVAGIDHVGVGADFVHHLYQLAAVPDIAEWSPDRGKPRYDFTGMLDSEDLPALTAELLKRRYTEADLRKIYHQNYLRVIEAVLGGS